MSGFLKKLIELTKRLVFAVGNPLKASNNARSVVSSKLRTQQSGLCKLNYDILYTIMKYLVPPSRDWGDKTDLLPLMLTCRTLHDVGMSVYLGGGTLRLVFDYTRKVDSFCKFILSDPRRAQYLRDLHLRGHFIPPYAKKALTKRGVPRKLSRILRNAKNLVNLSVFGTEEIFALSSRLSSSMSSIPRLEKISLDSAGKKAVTFLAKSRSKASDVQISFRRCDMPTRKVQGRQILVPLVHFADHLTQLDLTLSLGWFHLYDVPGPIFPKVRKLRVEGTHEINTAMLMRSFPKLWRLELRANATYEGMDEDALAQARNASRLSMGCDQSWHHLDELCCSIRMAYVLGLTCRVSFWCVTSCLSLQDKSLFQTLLDDLRPSHLHLDIDTFRLPRGDLFLRRSHITHLIVTIAISQHNPAGTPDALDMLDLWISKLGSLQFLVAYIDIRFGPVDVETTFDTEAYTRRLARSSPHLRYAHFPMSSGPSSSWEISRSGPDAELKSLTGDEFRGKAPDTLRCCLMLRDGNWYPVFMIDSPIG